MVTQYDILIIGGGIAGASAATEAKTSNVSASVAILSQEPMIYSRAALTSIIRGDCQSLDDIAIYPLRELSNLGVKFLGDYEALSIDHRNRSVQIKSSLTHKVLRVDYKKLVIATGSVPAISQIEGYELSGVFTVKWPNETFFLSQYLTPEMNALIVGAGFIGLKTAEALIKRGMKVTIAVRSRILRKYIEPIFSLNLKEFIEQKGVRVLTEVSPIEIGGRKKVDYVKLGDEKVPASIVVFATGVTPNINIAKRVGVKLGTSGAIKVNHRMQTSVRGIYAAGDCTETINLITGKTGYCPLGSLAAKTGEVAGSNAAGIEKTFPGFLRRQYENIFGMHIISMGLSTEEAYKLGIPAESLDVRVKYSKHDLFSTRMPLDARMKVIIEKGTGVIIGWQAIGQHRQIFRYSLCLEELIRNGQRVSDLQELGPSIQ